MNEKLWAARNERLWSVTDVCRICRVGEKSYRRWERGEVKPNFASIKQLIQGFGLSAEELGFGSPPQVPIQSKASKTFTTETTIVTDLPQEESETDSLIPSITPSSNKFLILTREEAAALLECIKAGDHMTQFDPKKRATLHRILDGLTILGGVGTLQTFVDPEPWERLAFASSKPAAMNEAAIGSFRSMTRTCWQLSNTGELEIAQNVLSTFLPRLTEIAPYQPEVAHLASEGLRLRSILVAHQLNLPGKASLCQQAIEQARHAHDSNALVAALTEAAIAFRYTEQPEEALKVCQEALIHTNRVSPLLAARAYMFAAKAFASYGRTNEAIFYMDLAHKVFPDHPESDPSFSFANFNVFSLSLYTGLMYLDLDEPIEAWNAFESYKQRQPGLIVPERVRLEIVNHQGRAAVLSKNLDQYAFHLEDSLAGATKLKSRKRLDEALTIYQQDVPASWLHDPQIKQLAEQFRL